MCACVHMFCSTASPAGHLLRALMVKAGSLRDDWSGPCLLPPELCKQAKLRYSMKSFDFARAARAALGSSSKPSPALARALVQARRGREELTRRKVKDWKQSAEWLEFLQLYERFLVEWVVPQFGCDVLVQAEPVRRIVLPGSVAPCKPRELLAPTPRLRQSIAPKLRHRPSLHPLAAPQSQTATPTTITTRPSSTCEASPPASPTEQSVGSYPCACVCRACSWVPLTHVWGANSLWIESAPGLADFRPVEACCGQAVRFYGNRGAHFTVTSTSDGARVSFDFRVLPAALAQKRECAAARPPRRRAAEAHRAAPLRRKLASRIGGRPLYSQETFLLA